MDSEREPLTTHSLVFRVLEKIGLLGILTLLWTVVTSCALLGGDLSIVALVWPDLFKVWLSLAGLSVASTILLAIAGRRAERAEAAQPARQPQLRARDKVAPPA